VRPDRTRRMAAELDEMVAEFRNRPLDAGPYTYVWMDALTQKVREGGRIVNVAVVIAVGVNNDGHREVLGLDVITTEDGAGWLAFLRGLVARGLSGVSLVISDAHPGLVDAIASTLPGATWQRCRTHYMRNLLTKVPKAAQAMVATLVRTIFAQPDAASVWAQHARVVEQLNDQFPDAATHLADAAPDVLAFTGFPKEHWRQIWSNNPRSGSTRSSGAAPTSWASSPTATPSSVSSVPCSLSSTTSGPSPGATWPPKASPKPACASSTATSRR
jgi:putative transposase